MQSVEKSNEWSARSLGNRVSTEPYRYTALNVICRGAADAPATSIVHLFFEVGADPNPTNNDGNTPLAFLPLRYHYGRNRKERRDDEMNGEGQEGRRDGCDVLM